MNRRFAFLLLAAVLAGCASFDQAEIAHVRQQGVSPGVVAKLDQGKPVAPADVIELTKRGVRDEWIIRQIEDHGVDSYVTRSDVTTLRRAGVRTAVIDALLKASDRFADDYRYRQAAYFDAFYGDPYYDFYGPYPGYWYGGFGGAMVSPRYHHFHHHR